MTYRPEIDGLRAIAVLSVVFYHAGFVVRGVDPFQGGFIGVDIFFVISGYLISSIILREMAQGRFTFLGFYERRARRILPALFLVIIVCLPLAWMYMFPKAMKEFAQSVIAAIVFGSNILFWQEDSYTAEPSALKPLLHTWSLSVEEQFYVLFPIALLILWKYARAHIVTIFIIGFVLSLGLAEWASRTYPDASFYLLPTRGWELLAGALLATWEMKGLRDPSTAWAKIMPILGLIGIACAVMFFPDNMVHPGFWTMIPILSVMALIWFCGGEDWVSKMLSSKPFVAVGLISYSLYLWHYPLFAFARITSVNALTVADKFIVIALSFILAGLGWWLVEQPFRNKRKILPRQLWASVAASAFVLLGMDVAINAQDGLPNRIPTFLMSSLENAIYPAELLKQEGESCHGRWVNKACHLGQGRGFRNWILVGDSHLGAMSSILWRRLEPRGFGLIDYTSGGCHYAPGAETIINGRVFSTCKEKRNERVRRALLSKEPGTIIIHGRLPLHLNGTWFDNKEGGVEDFGYLFMRPIDQDLDDNERIKRVGNLILKGIRELLDYGHRVILVYPTPEVGWNVPQTIFKIIPKYTGSVDTFFKEGGLSTSYGVFKERTKNAYAVYDSIGEHPNVVRVYPETIFCNTRILNRCITHDEETVYYYDDDHLSLDGSALVVGQIMDAAEAKWGM